MKRPATLCTRHGPKEDKPTIFSFGPAWEQASAGDSSGGEGGECGGEWLQRWRQAMVRSAASKVRTPVRTAACGKGVNGWPQRPPPAASAPLAAR